MSSTASTRSEGAMAAAPASWLSADTVEDIRALPGGIEKTCAICQDIITRNALYHPAGEGVHTFHDRCLVVSKFSYGETDIRDKDQIACALCRGPFTQPAAFPRLRVSRDLDVLQRAILEETRKPSLDSFESRLLDQPFIDENKVHIIFDAIQVIMQQMAFLKQRLREGRVDLTEKQIVDQQKAKLKDLFTRIAGRELINERLIGLILSPEFDEILTDICSLDIDIFRIPFLSFLFDFTSSDNKRISNFLFSLVGGAIENNSLEIIEKILTMVEKAHISAPELTIMQILRLAEEDKKNRIKEILRTSEVGGLFGEAITEHIVAGGFDDLLDSIIASDNPRACLILSDALVETETSLDKHPLVFLRYLFEASIKYNSLDIARACFDKLIQSDERRLSEQEREHNLGRLQIHYTKGCYYCKRKAIEACISFALKRALYTDTENMVEFVGGIFNAASEIDLSGLWQLGVDGLFPRGDRTNISGLLEDLVVQQKTEFLPAILAYFERNDRTNQYVIDNYGAHRGRYIERALLRAIRMNDINAANILLDHCKNKVANRQYIFMNRGNNWSLDEYLEMARTPGKEVFEQALLGYFNIMPSTKLIYESMKALFNGELTVLYMFTKILLRKLFSRRVEQQT